MISTLFFASFALAGEPVRCVAVASTPTPACGLRGSFAITAGGRTEAAATRAAREALARALVQSVSAVAVAQPLSTLDPVACSALADNAHVDCFPDAALAKPQYCFVALEDENCWDSEVITFEDTGWKAFSRGTKEMCKAVDERLVTQNYTDLERRRAECAASCLKSTTVRCP
jgi:hypothetical protein